MDGGGLQWPFPEREYFEKSEALKEILDNVSSSLTVYSLTNLKPNAQAYLMRGKLEVK